MSQNEALEREKLARVAAEAERRSAADEARRAYAELQQAAAGEVQQALADASQRENQLRCAVRQPCRLSDRRMPFLHEVVREHEHAGLMLRSSTGLSRSRSRR